MSHIAGRHLVGDLPGSHDSGPAQVLFVVNSHERSKFRSQVVLESQLSDDCSGFVKVMMMFLLQLLNYLPGKQLVKTVALDEAFSSHWEHHLQISLAGSCLQYQLRVSSNILFQEFVDHQPATVIDGRDLCWYLALN